MKKFLNISTALILMLGLLCVNASALTVTPLDPADVFSPEIIEKEKDKDVYDQPNLPTTPSAPSTPSGISVTVNGMAVTWTDAAPFIDANSRTMVPLRAVADAMGLNVNWDGSAREATFTNGNKTIYFPIDSNTARTSNGGIVQMDTAAVIVNDRTYAPIRYLAEYFGYEVGWDAATRTVTIK